MQTITHLGLSWTDVEDPKREEIGRLAGEHRLHPLNLDDCLSMRQLPKVDEHEDHLYVLFHLPVYDQKEGRVRKSQVSIFMGKDYVVTLHGAEMTSLTNLFLNCMEMDRLRAVNMQSPARLLYHILDVLVDSLYPTLDRLQGNLDEIEDKVFDQRASVAVRLSLLRRVIADTRRIVSPLRRLSNDLMTKVKDYSSEDLSKYYSDVRDHVEKAWEVLEQAEETIEIYKDTDFVLSQELTNKVLAVLTVVFTLTIPASVIGGLYGMNVPLPGGLNPGPFTFLGPYTTFVILMAASIAVAVGMVMWFRREGWF